MNGLVAAPLQFCADRRFAGAGNAFNQIISPAHGSSVSARFFQTDYPTFGRHCAAWSLDGAAVAVASEAAEFGRQLPVRNLRGDVVEDVVAGGLGKRGIRGCGVFDVDTELVDGAVLLAGDAAERVP